MRNQQNETGQISLFAQPFSTPLKNNSERIANLRLLRNEIERLGNSLKECSSLSRSTDPITSKVAGEKTKEFRARHISKILGCLKENGPKTYKEIALLIGMEPVAVARRRKEMEENHLIEVLEETRNGCSLWKAK